MSLGSAFCDEISTEFVSGSSLEAISLTEAKAHLHVAHSADDTHIQTLMSAATRYAENWTGRRFVTQTWKQYLSNFPAEPWIELRYPKLQSVTHVKYYDPNDAQQTMSGGLYTAIVNEFQPGTIDLNSGQSWPTTIAPNKRRVVEIQFICGFGNESQVPKDVKLGVLQILAHLYENREPIVVGSTPFEIPMSAESFLMPYKIHYLV